MALNKFLSTIFPTWTAGDRTLWIRRKEAADLGASVVFFCDFLRRADGVHKYRENVKNCHLFLKYKHWKKNLMLLFWIILNIIQKRNPTIVFCFEHRQKKLRFCVIKFGIYMHFETNLLYFRIKSTRLVKMN